MKIITSLKFAKTKSDLANILQIKPSFLTHTLYIAKPRYRTFDIPKRSGGSRTIQAPDDNVKSIQKKLSKLLLDCIDEINENKSHKYTSTLSHGFARNKSIATNGQMHLKKKNVLNLDLANFFGEFNFGRVRGFFIKNNNFKLQNDIATVIAQISCYDNSLPQGSPCSPVISNLITHSLDIRLAKLASQNSSTYSRYADDLTFSTREEVLPSFLAFIKNNKIYIGKKLRSEIERAGFKINEKKSRIQYKSSRQDVTGLIVNKKVNIKSEYWRKIRAQCHNLFKSGGFITKANGVESQGKINVLEGQLNFIDSIDRHNHLRLKSINKKGLPNN